MVSRHPSSRFCNQIQLMIFFWGGGGCTELGEFIHVLYYIILLAFLSLYNHLWL